MHISEGILSGSLLAGGYIFAFVGTGIGLKKMDLNKVAESGILSAVFFVASLVHLPIGISNAHLTLSGLVGLLLGWMSFPTIVTALLIQAIMFQYGGITTLGINTVIMAVPAVFCYYFFNFLVVRNNIQFSIAAFICGVLSVFMGGLLLSFSLFFTNNNFKEIAIIVMLAHLPMMVVEGIITASCISFLIKVKPEILPKDLFKKCSIPITECKN
jgi:cobalt/nickel transport system permease protein